MSKKIILVANYLADGQESMVQFGETMRKLLVQHQIRLIHWQPARVFHRLSPLLPTGFTKWLAYIDKFVLGIVSLSFVRLRHPGAIWHIVDHGNAMYSFVLPAKKVLITCHDCIAIEDALYGRTHQKIGLLGPTLQRAISAGLRRSAIVVCDSQATADDLFRLVAPKPNAVRVVYIGMVQILRTPDLPTAMRILKEVGIDVNRPFIFMIGSDLKRKNRANVIKCFDVLRSTSTAPSFQLVMAGKPMEMENRSIADASPWRTDIIETGRIESETLAAAYKHACVVMFPSLAEGFGLPIVEAQSCGAALITSKRQPMAEIAGEGALLVDPENPSEMAAGVLSVIEDGGALRNKGQQNAERFTPERMLRGYLDAYQSLGYQP